MTFGSRSKLVRIAVFLLFLSALYYCTQPFAGESDSANGLVLPSSLKTPESIPHIIHQSWKTLALPPKFAVWSASWRKFHPTWKHVIWTDADNDRLVEDHFPFFLATYKGLGGSIERADVSRYMYLHKYGGVYADLDVESVANIERTLKGSELALCLIGKPDWEHSTPNSWMASKPGHSFWMFMLNHIMTHVNDGNVQTEYKTGPVVLNQVLKLYLADIENEEITLLPQNVIHPYNWGTPLGICSAESDDFDSKKCKAKMVVQGTTVAITYWSHSWGGVGISKLDSMNGVQVE